MTETTQLAKKEQNMAEVFMTQVITEFATGDSDVALTHFQKRLAKNYFVTLDAVLAKAEAGRLKKKEKWRDKVPATWDHINMQKLAQDVVAVCRIGLDPAQKNHISMIPYKNNTTKLYDVGFIEGYRGIELKSIKYGLDIPDAVIVELVYSSDKFQSYKKDNTNDQEGYDFDIVNDFNRGEIIGGFYYHQYTDRPEKNKLVVMTLEEIEKRKPRYASSEFWGGEKPKWENSKKVGTEKVEGWPKEMMWKTVYRAAYNNITIDSQKIDADYMRIKEIEGSVAKYAIQEDIDEKANKEFVDIDNTTGEVVDAEFTADTPQPSPEEPEPEKGTSTPPENKEAAKAQESPAPDKKFGAENTVDTALRTAKEEKEKAQREAEKLRAKPKYVKELNDWLDGTKSELREACFQKIKTESFQKLVDDDRDKVIVHFNELVAEDQANANANEQHLVSRMECDF